MAGVEPFKVYRITRHTVPGSQHDADIQEEFVGDFGNIYAVMGFIEHMLAKEPCGQSRWRVRDAEGTRISTYDYELLPDRQFDLFGREGQRLTIQLHKWDIFNHWWDGVDIEVVSGSFCGKGHDYYLSQTSLFNVAKQILCIIKGKRDSYYVDFAQGALRFSIIRRDAETIEVAGVLRSDPNHGKQRVEFSFNSDQALLATTVSQLREALTQTSAFGDLRILDPNSEKPQSSQ